YTAQAQKIDWENAPLNPVALPYLKEHFNVKGDVYVTNGRYAFDDKGRLIAEGGIFKKAFRYPSENTIESEGYRYEIDRNGLLQHGTLIAQSIICRRYIYDSNNRLISVFDGTMGKQDFKYYTYDNSGRVITEKQVVDKKIKSSLSYTYEKGSDGLKITTTDLEKDKIRDITVWKGGLKIKRKENNTTNLLDLIYDLDREGNVVSLTGSGSTNPQTVFYRKELKKKNILTIKRVADAQGMFTDMYEIYRNGKISEEVVIEEIDQDALIYDPFDSSYYVLKNGFKRLGNNYKKYDVAHIPKDKELPIQLLVASKETLLVKGILGWKLYDLGKRRYKSSPLQLEKRQIAFDPDAGKNGITYISNDIKEFNGIQYSLPLKKTTENHAFMFTDSTVDNFRLVVKGFLVYGTKTKVGLLKSGEQFVSIDDKPTYILPNKKDLKPHSFYELRDYFGEEIAQ
ncbi:MAG: hypothetical protein NWQ19_01055, partial [Nonlabens sp.]|nr:hypothetical protein [Nonlabens sp.]